MFREELKSCEESRILLGKRFSSVQGFSESDTEISREVTGVCVIFIKSLQCNTTGTYTGYRLFSVQSYFNTSLLSEVVIIQFHVQNTWLKEQRRFTQNIMCFQVHVQTGRNKISETFLSSVIKMLTLI